MFTESPPAKIRLTLFLFTDIRTGAGTERVALNLIDHKPEDFEITVVETDFLDVVRIPVNLAEKAASKCKIIKFHKEVTHPIGLLRNNLLVGMWDNLITRPVHREYRGLKEFVRAAIRDTDEVYLMRNQYAAFFRGINDIPIIASDHCDVPPLPPFYTMVKTNNSVRRALRTLYYRALYRLYYKPINGLHAFPKDQRILDRTNVRYKMILSNGVDTSIFHPDYHRRNRRIRFLFVARLIKEKGLDILLPVIDMLHGENLVEFHIAGGGPMEEDVRQRKGVIYHGVLSNEDLAELYRQCDVFVYPSHNDIYSLVVLEALASGLYVLTGEFQRKTFDDFEGKYLEYIPMKAESFYKRVQDIIKDRRIIEHDKRAQFEYIKANYDWSVIADRFYDYMRTFYEESKKISDDKGGNRSNSHT
ncbi:MAG: glycosyltransferase family 4 protein [Nitrososphaerota archaeon]|jgi:glycosyltransferase involved in cell wall biosynthesis|nr:glycosyltransferase family 4 protein [Nitrososphaerota archaeon]MDG7042774.1 glycosyltransferase family 4 protein [Nitrososphaerota archaeon]